MLNGPFGRYATVARGVMLTMFLAFVTGLVLRNGPPVIMTTELRREQDNQTETIKP